MEEAGPDEGEADARHVSYEAHQDGEVRNHNGEDDGDHHDDDAEGEAPHLELAVQRPNGWETGLGLALYLHKFFSTGSSNKNGRFLW